MPGAEFFPCPAFPLTLKDKAGESVETRQLRLRSIDSRTRAYMTLTNETDEPLTVYWLDFRGKEVSYGSVKPGQATLLATFANHPWTCRDDRWGLRLCLTLGQGAPPATGHQQILLMGYQAGHKYRHVRAYRPPCVAAWSPALHRFFPARCKAEIRALLLCHRRLWCAPSGARTPGGRPSLGDLPPELLGLVAAALGQSYRGKVHQDLGCPLPEGRADLAPVAVERETDWQVLKTETEHVRLVEAERAAAAAVHAAEAAVRAAEAALRASQAQLRAADASQAQAAARFAAIAASQRAARGALPADQARGAGAAAVAGAGAGAGGAAQAGSSQAPDARAKQRTTRTAAKARAAAAEAAALEAGIEAGAGAAATTPRGLKRELARLKPLLLKLRRK